MGKTAINLHHTAIYAKDDVAEQFDAVNEGHRKRWNGKTKSKMGFYGGYHYIIERSGEVQQFRNDWENGAHNDKGIKWVGIKRVSANYYALGVCFAGNMSRQNLSDAQVKAGVELINQLKEKHKIFDKDITPHRAHKATQCPGNNFPDPAWDYLKEMYDKLEEPWKKQARDWAMSRGVSNGDRPDDPVTRVELWQTIKNYHEKLLKKK